jgi:hypothetical protein
MPALPEQISEFGFGGGLTEKQDSWLSSSGFGTLQNCVQDKTGALEKHPGYVAFSSAFRNGDANVPVAGLLMDAPTLTIGNAPKLLKRGELVAAISDGLLLAKTDELTLQGRVSPWVCEQRIVCQADGERFDACCSGNWSYTAHELEPLSSTGGVRVVATYLPTKETVTFFAGGNIPLTTISEPRIVAVDTAGTAVLFYMNGAQGKYHVVTPDGVGAVHNITLNTGYDVVSDPASNKVWTMYFIAALVTSDGYNFAANVLSVFGTTSQAANTAVECSICVDVPSNRLTLCWVEYIPAGGPNFVMAVIGLARTTNYVTSLWSPRSIWRAAVAEPINFAHQIMNLGVASSPFDGNFVAFTDKENDRVVGHWVSPAGVVEGGGVSNGVGDVVAPKVWLRTRPAWDGKRMFCLADTGFTGAHERRAHLVSVSSPGRPGGKRCRSPSASASLARSRTSRRAGKARSSSAPSTKSASLARIRTRTGFGTSRVSSSPGKPRPRR